jgi:hypothetical protein
VKVVVISGYQLPATLTSKVHAAFGKPTNAQDLIEALLRPMTPP